MTASPERLFAFRLAAQLGCTVAELADRMSSAEFTDWMAYYQLEPFGTWRDNWHTATLCALTYNINRGNSPAVSSKDFMYEDPDVARRREFNQLRNFLDSKVTNGGGNKN